MDVLLESLRTFAFPFLVGIGVFLWSRRLTSHSSSKGIPEVSDSLPLVGHLIQFFLNPVGFLEKCYERYGGLCLIRLGRKRIAVIFDPELLKEIQRADEEKLSFYQTKRTDYASRVFSEKMGSCMRFMPSFMKQELFSTAFLSIANNTFHQRIKKYLEIPITGPIQLKDIVESMFHESMFKAVFNFDLTPSTKLHMNNICSTGKFFPFLTYLVPEEVLEWAAKRWLFSIGDKYNETLIPIITAHLRNSGENSSPYIRAAINYAPMKTDAITMTPVQLASLMMATHFTTIVMPGVVLGHVIRCIASRPDLVKQIRTECNPNTMELQDIISNKILNACLVETCRVNADIFLLKRIPGNGASLGPFALQGVDLVVIPGAVGLDGSPIKDIYENPSEFHPERFLGDQPTPRQRGSYSFWGTGIHTCVGKILVSNTLKLFLANFIHSFDIQLYSVKKKNYITAVPLPNQEAMVILTPVYRKIN